MIEVQSDGKFVNCLRDPPGQKCVYILPGDARKQNYRLSTFKDYPRNLTVNISDLTAAGFFYTGYKDQVKCFSCGQAIEDWTPKDDSMSTQWHQRTCLHAYGSGPNDIPVERTFNRSINNPIHSQPITKIKSTIHEKRSAGHILTFGIENQDVDMAENVSAFGVCSVSSIHSSPPASVVAAQQAVEIAPQTLFNTKLNEDRTTECEVETAEHFPCRNAINPHMKNESSRLETYVDNRATWPADKVNSSMQDIARAGFYYLGRRDKVKCWYCNGILQNWEQDDEPWQEHAKWFPLCEFVLQQKGIDFVHDVVTRFPDLRRPELRNPAPVNILERTVEVRANDSAHSSNALTRNIMVIDPKQQEKEQEKKVVNEMATSELVQQAIEMDFAKRDIEAALRRQYRMNNQGFASMTNLVEILLSLNTEQKVEIANSTANTVVAASNVFNSTPAIIEKLENARKCKNCWNEKACVVLIPCGHLACCLDCSKACKSCPVCSSHISETIRSYIV